MNSAKISGDSFAPSGDSTPIVVIEQFSRSAAGPPGAHQEVVEARLRRWSDAKHLPLLHVQKWLALEEPGRTRLLEIAETLKMRAGQCIVTLALLEEIAIREGQSISAILDRPALRRILNLAGSGPGRTRAMLDELRTMRYPRLKRAAQRLAEEVSALKLPPHVRVLMPRDLASDEVRVQIVAHGSAEMAEALACLAAKSGELARLASRLGGLDGVLMEADEAPK